jgi:ketosteroid isomerase-like protein
LTDIDPAQTAVDTATRFLRLVEDRDLSAAAQCLAPDVEIVFPGGRRFSNLESQIESSRERFRSVTKILETCEVVAKDREMVVYVTGQLSGVDGYGDAFDSVRFVDRIVIEEGLITRHWVWNDLAEEGVVPLRPGDGSTTRSSTADDST